jgi:hypothetical protein
MTIDIQLLLTFGIPSAITGLGIWWLKRKIEQNEAKAKEHEQNLEALVLMMMNSTRANTVGITAIARAVQRIPDAQCNGDMTAALEEMEVIQQKEKQFIMDKGIRYIFE